MWTHLMLLLCICPARAAVELEQLARDTGGGYFEVSRKHTLEQIYAQIQDELRNQYCLGYTSDRAGAKGEYRKIRVAVKQKGLVVQARDGYYLAG